MLVKGEFYKTLVEKRKDTGELKECMEETVQKLLPAYLSLFYFLYL